MSVKTPRRSVSAKRGGRKIARYGSLNDKRGGLRRYIEHTLVSIVTKIFEVLFSVLEVVERFLEIFRLVELMERLHELMQLLLDVKNNALGLTLPIR